MSKIKTYVTNISNILVISIACINVFNLMWIFLAKNIYWPIYSRIAHTVGWALFAGILILVPAICFSNITLPVRVILFGIAAIITCFELLTISYVPVYIDSTKVKDKTIILGMYGADNGSSCYILLECKGNSTYCKETEPRLSECTAILDYALNRNSEGDLDVFINGILVYTYGVNSYRYKFSDLDFYDNFIYWAVSTKDEEITFFVLGRCDEETEKSCEILQKYSNPEFQHINLDVDPVERELFIFLDGKLAYTLSNTAKEYDYIASVDTQKSLGNGSPSTYSVSIHENNGGYEYLLYECNARFFWCQILPFHYSTRNKEKVLLKIDESEKELGLFINDELIFIYGETPRCYVEGCKILEPLE